MEQTHLDSSIEKLVDSYSMRDVLESLTNIAYLKAEHIRANWQDEDLAREWEKVGSAIEENHELATKANI